MGGYRPGLVMWTVLWPSTIAAMSGRAGDQSHGAPVYALGSDPAERERLQRQSHDLRAMSSALLDHVRLAEGSAAIDLGCGPSGIIELLAARVGPTGRVVGLDFNPDNVALANEFARERGLANVEVVQGDARHTGLAGASFDLVHCRTLLINIPEPEGVVAEMVRLARPGGWVAASEPDIPLTICYPRLDAFEQMAQLFRQSVTSDGADEAVGRRLPELFRNAGLSDVGVEATMHVYPHGHSRRTVRADLFRTLRGKIVARGMADEAELDEIDRKVRAHLDDPRTLVAHTFFMAWGRKAAI